MQAGGKKSREQQQSWDDAQQPEQQHQQQSSNQFTDDAGDANLPMDLPALATVDSRAIPAAQPAAAAASGSGSRAGSTMQKRNSSMGGPSGPRIKTSVSFGYNIWSGLSGVVPVTTADAIVLRLG